MRHLRWLCLPLACLLLLPACKREDAAQKPTVEEPLDGGDAEWPEAPVPEPGGNGNGNGDGGSDGGDDGGASTSLGFTPAADFGSVSECDPFMQDCPEGEKCVAYASTGGQLDANKCVPVLGDQGAGQACVYDGVVPATDDCDADNYCWDLVDSMGACALFCGGTADNPMCPPGTSCFIGFDASVALCLDDGGDGDGDGDPTTTGDGDGDPMPSHEDPEYTPSPFADEHEEEVVCPDSYEDIVLYMSNDDSNSQASPALVRSLIQQGRIVSPERVRIHEFLNYYTLAYDPPEDSPAEVGIQMRRTDAETGEFTLLLYAQGQLMRPEDRPPMNLAFSLDTSGSMSGAPIERLKDSMVALAGQLRAGDVISMVEWSSSAAVLLENHAVSGPNDPVLVAAIENLTTGGSTDLHGGLTKAYEVAAASYIAGGLNRVVLVSDGGANAGETSIDVIAQNAAAEDGSGIYLVGVGVGEALGYNDTLMDEVTDAGKGAYLFIDSSDEAELQFGSDKFLANVAVAARDVQMRVTLPWYFGIKSFHGEEYSADPAEVEPQHLAPNDAMSFHQVIGACDPSSIDAKDTIEARVEYLHPITLEPMSDSVEIELGKLVEQDATQLYKSDVVVAFAKAMIFIGYYWDNNQSGEALALAAEMKAWLGGAADDLGDPEVMDMAQLMGQYHDVLSNTF